MTSVLFPQKSECKIKGVFSDIMSPTVESRVIILRCARNENAKLSFVLFK